MLRCGGDSARRTAARVTRIRELTENPPAERSPFCYMNALSPRNLTVVHRAVPRVEHVPDYTSWKAGRERIPSSGAMSC
jgi:hypothetical protein